MRRRGLDGYVAKVVRGLAKSEPFLKPSSASVAIILRDEEPPSVLLIRRAERSGDPWSGQIALPGGRSSPKDRDPRDTAARETFEEVGIDLNAKAEFLGYGKTATTYAGAMEVVPVVFGLNGEVGIKPNDEVASYRWVGLQELQAPRAKSIYRFESLGRSVEMPAYLVEDYVVWGLTHRILSSVFV